MSTGGAAGLLARAGRNGGPALLCGGVPIGLVAPLPAEVLPGAAPHPKKGSP